MGFLDKLLAKIKGESPETDRSAGDMGGAAAPEAARSEPMPSAATSTAGSAYGEPPRPADPGTAGESPMGDPEAGPDDRPGGPV